MKEEPDLVDRIFELLALKLPPKDLADAKAAVREEFGGEPGIPKRSWAERKAIAHQVLRRFNGRNASELARELGIGRASVYRMLKQSVSDPVEMRQPTP